MNESTKFWLEFFGRMAGLGILVAGAAALVAVFVRSATGRRVLWQAAVFSIFVLFLGELTGVSQHLGAWARGGHTLKPKSKVAFTTAQILENAGTPANALSPAMTRENFTAPVPDAPNHPWWPALLWLAGCSAILARRFLAAFIFNWIRWWMKPVSDADILTKIQALKLRLNFRRPVRVLESERLPTPVAFGILRPTIGLPQGFGTDFTVSQQEAMLAHELAHLAAGDLFWQWLADSLAALLWWHPLVWWLRRQLRLASELAADEASLVVENGPGALAESLVTLGKRLAQTPAIGWLSVLGLGFRSGLGQRITRLIKLDRPGRTEVGCSSLWFGSLAGAVATSLILAAATAWTRSPDNLSDTWPFSWQQSVAGRAVMAMRRAPREGEIPALHTTPARLPISSNPAKLLVQAKPAAAMPPASRDSTTNLITRVFKINTNAIAKALRDLPEAEAAAGPDRNAWLKGRLEAAGIQLVPPKNCFLDQRTGHLVMRATSEELDKATQVLQALELSTLQVLIETRICEVTGSEKTLDITRLFGGVLTNHLWRAPQPNGTNAQQATTISIINDSQLQAVLRQIDKTPGISLLNSPRVITRGDMHAQLMVGEHRPVVTGLNPATNAANREPYDSVTETVKLGIFVDVMPRVLDDGLTIQLGITNVIKEFLGYDKEQVQIPMTRNGRTVLTKASVPIPRVLVRQLENVASVWDGQTLVLFGGASSMVTLSGGQISIAAEKAPPPGSKVKRELEKRKQRQLLVFATLILVDDTGNRLRPVDKPPYPTAPVPKQP